MKVSHGLVAGALLLLAVPVWAQTPSLGDLAKKEAERRKAAPPATKTVTNDDLSKVASDPAAAADAKAVQQAKAADAANKAADAKSDDTKDATKDATKKDDKAEPAQDETFWKGKMASAREELRRNGDVRARRCRRASTRLTADFTDRDDPVPAARRSPTTARRRSPSSTRVEDRDRQGHQGDLRHRGRGAQGQRASRLDPLSRPDSSSSRTRTRSARCCGTRWSGRTTPSSRRAISPRRCGMLQQAQPAVWSSPICGFPKATASACCARRRRSTPTFPSSS